MNAFRQVPSVSIKGNPPKRDARPFRSSPRIKSWPADLEIEGWSESLCLRTQETKRHTLFVAEMTVRLARWAGIPECEIANIRYGALLHDIGKTAIPASILMKPEKLSPTEWEAVKKHPRYAYDLLFPVSYLRPSLAIPFSHHEKWDGSGYPEGRKCEEIPLVARIFAVVDVWDVLTSDLVYRKAWSKEKAIEYLQQQSGAQFDPGIVKLFLSAMT